MPDFIDKSCHKRAIEKLRQLQQSPRWRGFGNVVAVAAWCDVKGSALAGKRILHTGPDNLDRPLDPKN